MTTSRPTSAAAGGPPYTPLLGRRLHGFALGSVLAALMLTLLLEALDQTVVGTALPRIIGDLHGFDRYTWVVTAYLLASTTMIPIVGKLSDQFGRKWFFVAGVVIFLIGSILSGASQTMNQLIAFRAVQGVGSGVGIALVFTVVGDIFPPAERAKWQGIFSAVYGFSSVVGPTVGGWLTDHGPLLGTFVTDATRWRWVFYVNLPFGIIALAAVLVYLPKNISARSNAYTGWAAIRRIDFPGAVFASSATICLLLGLTWGGNQTYAWNSPQVLGVLIASAILYSAFFVAERFAVEPVLPLDLFHNQVFAADALLSLTTGMILLSLVIYLPLFLQGVLGESATSSGEVITPLTVSLVVGATLSGFLVAKLGRYHGISIAGSLLLTAGVFLLTRMTSTTNLLQASIAMVITGIGLGIFFAILTLAVQNSIPRTRMGVGTGAVNYLRALGQTLGVAITGTVVNNTVASELVRRLPAGAAQTLTAPGLAAATNQQVLVNPAYRSALTQQAVGQAIAHGASGLAKAIAGPQIAQVPAGPNYAATVAAIQQQALAQATQQLTQSATALLHSVFAALTQAEAVGIERGFVVVLVFCAGVILGALFLKDVPLSKGFREAPATPSVATAEPTEQAAQTY